MTQIILPLEILALAFIVVAAACYVAGVIIGNLNAADEADRRAGRPKRDARGRYIRGAGCRA